MVQAKPKSEWINSVLKKGTIADRLAAHTLLIHESKNWSSLDALIDMVDPKKCRRQCIMAMTTLKELFQESLNTTKKKSESMSEDDIKKVRFFHTKFIDKLHLVAFDNLEETRKKAIWVLSELLRARSENKEYIVEKLVDKMGDKVPRIATTAGHLVEKAINSEKAETRLKAIKCVQRFLKRPRQTLKARYYAISLLTRIKLLKDNHEMANQLIDTYLDLYTTLTKEKNLDSKLMSAILVGIHRAYPYSRVKNDVFEQHLQTLYSLVHQVNFRMRVVAMVLIKNIVTKRAQILKCPVEDRLYNLVFGQIIQPELHTCSRQQAFASLLLSVINDDEVLARKEAFVKRMLMVAVNSSTELSEILLTTITKIKGFNSSLNVTAKEEEKDDKMDTSDEEEFETAEEGEEEEGQEQIKPSWIHKQRKTTGGYDPLARNPRAAKPEQYNELYLLRRHFEPNISRLARTITGELKLQA